MLTCEICIEPMPKSEQFNNKAICSHPFCVDCISKYIQIKIKDKTGSGLIACPGFNCPNQLDPFSCKELIPPKLFVEWCDLLCETTVPWPHSSFCPNPDCLELVVNECGGFVRESRCPNCRELFCFQCKKKWDDQKHKLCRKGRISDFNDVLFRRLMKKQKWVQCPCCGHCIQRSQGCSTMKCIRCWTKFCYKCGGKTCICISEDFGCALRLLGQCRWRRVLNFVRGFTIFAATFSLSYGVALCLVSLFHYLTI